MSVAYCYLYTYIALISNKLQGLEIDPLAICMSIGYVCVQWLIDGILGMELHAGRPFYDRSRLRLVQQYTSRYRDSCCSPFIPSNTPLSSN